VIGDLGSALVLEEGFDGPGDARVEAAFGGVANVGLLGRCANLKDIHGQGGVLDEFEDDRC
jgi:hypothetical protein